MMVAVVKELGLGWLFCRALYSAKLIMFKKMPVTEILFEHNVMVNRIDLLPDNVERIERFIRGLSDDAKKALLSEADKACAGTVKGFSSLELSYGMPIDWQLNPITGRRCDASLKWYQIPDFDKERGDIKAVWEISRFSHFVTFARAYLASHDAKYYIAFREQLAHWLEHNPYPYGANFKCGQECALRMMNALLAYTVFRAKGLTDADDAHNLAELIRRCYQKILANFFYARRCIKNNHTISELAGMIIGAWCACDDKRMKKAYNLLNKTIVDQFSSDGGYTQYSFNYQRLALQVLEYVLYISKRTGYRLSDVSISRIKNSVELLYQCQDESGDVPNYGFNDGALVFPVSSTSYRDFRPVLGSLHKALFNKPLYIPGAYDEEAVWFDTRVDVREEANTVRKSMSFPEAGLFTLRNKDSWLMMVLNDYQKRPAHMDQLHIDLWVDGVNVLCDSGTYSYADPRGAELVLTGAHNTARLLGAEQMNKRGAFLLYKRTRRDALSVSPEEIFGRMRSQNGYQHERQIKQVPTGYTICDKLTANKNGDFELILHTPCQVLCEGKQVKLFEDGKQILTVESTLECEIREGIRSVYYLSEEPVSLICYKGTLKDGQAYSEMQFRVAKEVVFAQC